MSTQTHFALTDDPDIARCVYVGIQKGGVGKSTEAALLGSEIARLGGRVLLIDFDPNAILTRTILGFDPKPVIDDHGNEGEEALTVGDLLRNCRDGGAADAINYAPDIWQPRSDLSWEDGGDLVDGGALAFIPGYPSLQIEVDDPGAIGGERRLRRLLKGVARHFDVVFVDTGARADKSAITGMLACGSTLIPVQPESASVDGLSEHLRFVQAVVDGHEHPVRLLGAICTMYDGRNKVAHGQPLDEMRHLLASPDPDWADVAGREFIDGTEPGEYHGWTGDLIEPVVPRSTAVVNSTFNRRPLSAGLIPPDGGHTWKTSRSRDVTFKHVLIQARLGLRILQLMKAPCLPAVAEALATHPIPGVWPLLTPDEEGESHQPAANEG